MKKKKKITQELEEIEAIAITSDVWTATKQKRGKIGLTVHYFVDFVFKSLSLGYKPIIGNHCAKV